LGNIGNTTLTQAVNNQPIQPFENLTPGTVGTSFLGGVAGTSAVRMGAVMVNSGAAGTVAMMEIMAGSSAARLSTSLVVNPSGNVLRGTSAIAGGIASGTMKTETGTQNLPSFTVLPPPTFFGNSGVCSSCYTSGVSNEGRPK
jgi:hypothetical protein